MANNRPDAGKEGAAQEAPAASAQAPAAASGGGFKLWLPLIVNIVLMPVVAYFTTTLLLVPKLKAGQGEPAAAHAASKSEGHASSKNDASGHGSDTSGVGKSKFMAPLGNKILVNLAGTMGTRYLLASLTLVSNQPGVKELVEKSDAELRDAAASVLSAKSISDLEKPGARNLIRTELISVFNNVLGGDIVTELYLTEFAIQ